MLSSSASRAAGSTKSRVSDSRIQAAVSLVNTVVCRESPAAFEKVVWYNCHTDIVEDMVFAAS